MTAEDLSQLSMQELFRIEAESQVETLTSNLLALERDPKASGHLEACMRAAHSLKGAARIVDIDAGVALGHAMEDFFVSAQKGQVELNREHIDMLLEGGDLMMALTKSPDVRSDQTGQMSRVVDGYIENLAGMLAGQPARHEPIETASVRTHAAPLDGSNRKDSPSAGPYPAKDASCSSRAETAASVVTDGKASLGSSRQTDTPPGTESPKKQESSDRVLRVSADNLNRLLGLAGESLVDSRWLKPFGQSLLNLKRLQQESSKAIDRVREALDEKALDERAQKAIADAQRLVLTCQQFLSDRLAELDLSDRQSTSLAHRLYDQALACRMRPFADGIQGFPRMVRDVARSLGKQVRLDIVGTATPVDRDMLEMMDAPLGHLLRNAIDHGIEAPDERVASGKSPEGTITLEAHHSAGALQIAVSDDGRGINLANLRQAIVHRRLATAETADKLSENELLQFLFLPGFTMKEEVTAISGRGVGLDVVQDMIKQVRGVARISSQPGSGTRFQLQLPLTLSIIRTLLVEIAGEPYAFPLAFIVRAVKVPADKIRLMEGRQHFDLDGEQVGLVTAHQVLDRGKPVVNDNQLSVVVVGAPHNRYGIVVDRFLGDKELVLQPIDPRLGKIKDVSAAALLENGAPVLILDVEDMVRSMERIVQTDRLNQIGKHSGNEPERRRKRVLIVDDSLTVRELERKVLDRHGYQVEVAVDGVDGWNALRSGTFDLVVTDVDMPRMDGIELVSLMRKDAALKSLPVMIVSYKEREEDRRRGLEAGADYYLTKGSFHDDKLLQTVVDLIGEPTT